MATRDRVYAGKKACEECHSDEYQKLIKHEHKGLACEGCHGPGQAHADNPRKDNIEKSSFATCLRCHEANPVAAQMAQTNREQEPLHRLQVHGMPRAPQPVGGPMKNPVSRRSVLGRIGAAVAGLLAAPAAKAAKTVVQKVLVTADAPKGYDPTQHKWVMAIDANRCIGCGFCAEACKKENHVPEGPYFRTWVERYIITKPKPGSGRGARRDAGGLPERRHARLSGAAGAEGGDPAFLLRAQALQPLQALALRPGLPGRRDL